MSKILIKILKVKCFRSLPHASAYKEDCSGSFILIILHSSKPGLVNRRKEREREGVRKAWTAALASWACRGESHRAWAQRAPHSVHALLLPTGNS